MPALTCNSCKKEFDDEEQQKLHYRSEWHRYNLKRKENKNGCRICQVAGVPGVTEELFQSRQSALNEEHSKSNATSMLYGCALCGKEYRSSKAHAQHLKSRAHSTRASQKLGPSTAEITTIKPYAARSSNKVRRIHAIREDEDEDTDSDDEWVEYNRNELVMASKSLSNPHFGEHNVTSDVEQDDVIDQFEELDTLCCFICDQKNASIQTCMVHMHKQHGFFIPDIEYLKNPVGFLTYVGLKVMRDFRCLYCSDRCHPFQSLEAVRKHIIAKGHCKLRYGDEGEVEDVDLEDFYDYSSSYVDVDGKQLVASHDMNRTVELGCGGSELIITQKTENGIHVKTLGSRQFLRYYRQRPRPSPTREIALALSLASRYRVRSKQLIVRMKIMKELNRRGVESMRSKIWINSNIIRNLPRNVPY